jgi:hypothetical protein
MAVATSLSMPVFAKACSLRFSRQGRADIRSSLTDHDACAIAMRRDGGREQGVGCRSDTDKPLPS